MQDWVIFEDIQGQTHYINRHSVVQISPNGLTGPFAANIIICGGGVQGIQVALTPGEIIDKLQTLP